MIFNKGNFRRNLEIYVLTLISALIFFFYTDFSPIELNDSQGYIDMEIIRSPLYPMFLEHLRTILSDDTYLLGAIITQTIIAIAAVYAMLMNLKKHFGYSWFVSILVYPFVMSPFVIEAFSGHGVLFTDSILTEGLAYSLFYFYICLFLNSLYAKTNKTLLINLISSYILSGFLILLRGQMQITLIINILLTCFILIRKVHFNIKKMLVALSLIIGVLLTIGISKCITAIYTTNHFGEKVNPEFTNTSYMINFLYAADNEDRDLFIDDDDYELIAKMFDAMFDDEENYANRGDNLEDKANHLLESNRLLKLHTFIPLATEYYGSMGYDEVQTYKNYEDLSLRMTSKLAPLHMDRWIEGVVELALSGLPDAIFFKFVKYRTACYIIAYGILIISLIAGLWRYFTCRESKSAQLMLATMIMLVGNLLACSLVIGPISRYLLYFWGLVYISWILFIDELIHYNKKSG